MGLATTAHGPSTVASTPAAAAKHLALRAVLLACGILSSLTYVAMNVVGALRWKGYSTLSQTISELSAIDAPSRPAVVPLGIGYDLLLIGFGVGVWMSAGSRRGLRVTAGSLIAIGAIGPFWPPMHLRGTVITLTDTLHIVFTVIVSLLTLLAIGFGAAALGRGFRRYSIATVVVLLVFGALTSVDGPKIAANLPTPWVGLNERINLGAYLMWVAVVGVALLRSDASPDAPRAQAASSGARSGKTSKLKMLVGSGDRIGLLASPFLVLGFALNIARPSIFAVGGPPVVLQLLSISMLLPGVVIWAWSAFLILTRVPRGELITNGPYALVKHPLYTGVALLVAPWLGFLLDTWLGAAIGIVLYAGSRLFSPEEERALSKTFGEAWDEYCGSVKLPWL